MKSPTNHVQGLVQNTRVSLFEMPLDIGINCHDILSHLKTENFLLSYLNPYAYFIARSNPEYASNLGRFDLIVCDGIGVQKAVSSVFRQTTPVISLDFSGIGHDYLMWGADKNMHICLVGGTQLVVEDAATIIRERYQGFKEVSFFSGYEGSPEKAKTFILNSVPGLVLVGLGMGKQESFLLELADQGWKGVGICVGGFFDKLAKPQLNYPKWSEKTKLRFLGRLLREPRRLSKRYFIDYQPFIGKYLKHVLKRK